MRPDLNYVPIKCSSADVNIRQRAPTSGGQYHWASMLAPSFCKKFVSYITGMHQFPQPLRADKIFAKESGTDAA